MLFVRTSGDLFDDAMELQSCIQTILTEFILTNRVAVVVDGALLGQALDTKLLLLKGQRRFFRAHFRKMQRSKPSCTRYKGQEHAC